MITYKDVENKSMPPEKREEAKGDLFSYYIGRKLTYLMTIPLLYTNITPNTVTWISIYCLIASFLVLCLAQTLPLLIVGWALFFLWSLLDGVDGNIARYKRQFSKLGDLYDTMGGYLSMALIYLGFGVAAAHMGGQLERFIEIDRGYYIILGALSSIFSIFPRLMMHKIISSYMSTELVASVKNKSEYSLMKRIALNISSIAGGVMVVSFVCCLTKTLDLFTIAYCALNFLKMIAALYSIFNNIKREEQKK